MYTLGAIAQGLAYTLTSTKGTVRGRGRGTVMGTDLADTHLVGGEGSGFVRADDGRAAQCFY